MDDEAWQAVRTHAAAEGYIKRLVGFFPELGSRRSFRSGGEKLGAEARFGRFGQAQSSDCVVSQRMEAQAKAASNATWSAK